MLALSKRLISSKLILSKFNRGLSKFNNFVVSDEVRCALNEDKPVVALESTIITHGMPYPQNVECALDVEADVRSQVALCYDKRKKKQISYKHASF